MGKLYIQGSPIANTFSVEKTAPIDDRLTVQSLADLTDGENGGIAALVYKGMIVYVADENTLYVYTGTTSATWKNKKTGAPMNGGLISNWKKIDTFMDPSTNLEYYVQKIGARVVESVDELTSANIEDPHVGMLVVVVGTSDASDDETGLYVLLDEDNTIENNWLKINGNTSDFVSRDDLKGYAKLENIPDISNLASKDELDEFLTGSDISEFISVDDLNAIFDEKKFVDEAALDLYVMTKDIADVVAEADFVKSDALNEFLTASDVNEFVSVSELNEILDGKNFVDTNTLTNYVRVDQLVDYLKSSDASDIFVTKEELADYALASQIPTKVSDLTNDAGYITEDDLPDYLKDSDLDDYATKDYVDDKITDLIGGAPSTLDTLKEIADALQDNATMSMVADAISTKANSADVYTKAEVDAKVDEVDAKVEAIPEEGVFPAIGESEGSDFNDGLATVSGVIDYVADAITAAEPDLSGYALKSELPVVPTNVGAFTNDAGYLTEHQDITGKADKSYVDEAVAGINIPTEGVFPDVEGSDDSDAGVDGYATVDGVMAYLEDWFEKKKEDLIEPDFLYTNGYRRGDTPTELTDPLNAYEIVLDENGEFEIELLHKNEESGWIEADGDGGVDIEQSYFGDYFKVILPSDYEIKLYMWDSTNNVYSSLDSSVENPAFRLVPYEVTDESTTYYYNGTIEGMFFLNSNPVESFINAYGHLMKAVIKKKNN